MNKILIITGNSNRHFYFVNQLIKNLKKEIKVITNAKKNKISFFQKCKKKLSRPLSFLRNNFLNFVFLYFGKKFKHEKISTENEYFKNQKNFFYSNYKDKELAKLLKKDVSVNDKKYINLIKQYNPDTILVMGSCLISSEIIDSSKNVINMHTGLSPYYRGGLSNFWPFINNQTSLFGVTIHEMSRGIDSGNIIFTDNVIYKKGDTFSEINCKAIVNGTKLMIETINLIDANKLKSIKQWEKGKIYNSYDFNNYFIYLYFINFNKIKESSKGNLTKPKLVKNGSILT